MREAEERHGLSLKTSRLPAVTPFDGAHGDICGTKVRRLFGMGKTNIYDKTQAFYDKSIFDLS